MRSIISFLLLSTCVHSMGQVFFQESFEETTGWTLSHQYDDGNDDYCERDSASALLELGYTLFGQDGYFVVAAEDTDGELGLSPVDGIATLSLDPIDITGQDDLELMVKLSCNAGDQAYDDRLQDNGDYLDFQVNIDGNGWETVGSFCSKAGGSSISTLYHDLDMDGDGGELGEPSVGNSMVNFLMPISGTGTTAEVRAVFKMDGTDEVIVMDDIRMKVSEGDVIPPTVYSASVIDANTLEVVFNEPMGSNAELLAFYSGISGLVSASLQPDDQTVILEYGADFVLGEPYQLVVFGVQDASGNAIAGAFSFPFYWNPTTPALVITEIMYNDPSVEDTLEFIEIYNHGAVDAIVGGFRIEGAVDHTLASVTIAPGGFYLVARNAEAAASFYSLSFEDYGGQLSDNNEFMRLVNVDGVILDSLHYNDNVPWPSAGDGFGPSIELVSPDADNSQGSNWVASENGLGVINGLPLFATPGTLPGGTLPVVQFDNNPIWVNEQDGVIELDFYIAGANANQSVVEVQFVAGTATSPADHGSNTISEVQLPANSSGVETIAFPLVNDGELEGVEYFTLSLSASSNCQIGLNDEIEIVIADDEYEAPEIYLNELQSSNLMTIEDGPGETDDWFEVYNPNAFEVDLAGYYMSDDPLDPLKDRLPAQSDGLIVPAFGFLLFWADEQGSQGPRHLGFKLSASGESLLLTSPDGEDVVDEVDFGTIATDDSYGRFCDGGDEWQVLTVPSPGYGNCVNGLDESDSRLLVYPNPTTGAIFLPSRGEIEILDAAGRILLNDHSDQMDLSGLPRGMYFLRFNSSSVTRLLKH